MQVEAYGKVLDFPDDMSHEDMAAAIKSNEHILNPDYKPGAAPLLDRAIELGKGVAEKFPGISRRAGIADQAEASATEGENTAAREIKGAPVRQSAYNKELLNPTESVGGIKGRISDVAARDQRGQKLQEELQGLSTDENVPEGGFLASAASMTGQTIKGVGRVASDYLGYDKDNPIAAYGEEILRNNPVAIRGLEDIKDRPFLAFKEATGNSVPSMGAMVGVAALGQGITSVAPLTGPAAPIIAAVGQVVSWLGPAAVAALPSYSGIRDKQILNDPKNEVDAKSKAIAALGAGAVGAIEVAFGPQQWAIAALTKEGRSALARKFAATSPLDAIFKGAVKGAVAEGSEELVQNPIEQLASYDNPTTKENVNETLFGGAMGAIGGFAPGGVAGGLAQRQNQINIERKKFQAQAAANRHNDNETKAGVDNIRAAGTVDEAIQAAQETVSKKPATADDVLRVVDPTLADIERLTGVKPSEQMAQEFIQESIQQGSENAQQKENQTTAKTNLLNEIVLPDGTSLPAKWDVVDADTVKASVREGVNQPRDRTRASANLQVMGIAKKPDYRRLSNSPVMDIGAPVIDIDGNIVGGNGRFEGVSSSYDQGTHEKYLANLIDDLENKGIDRSAIEGMRKPILVRRITEPFDTRRLAIVSNVGGSSPYSVLENARLDAERLTNIADIDVNGSGDIPLTQQNLAKISNSLRNYSDGEQSQFHDADGRLSQEGIRRIKGAILYNAYGNSPTLSRLIESTDNDMRNVTGALTKVAGYVAKVRSEIPKKQDITKDLIAAVEKFSQLREQDIPVGNYISQGDIFGDGLTDKSKEILQALDDNARSQGKIAAYIKDAYETLGKIESAKGGLFESNNQEQEAQETVKPQVEGADKAAKESAALFSKRPAQEDNTLLIQHNISITNLIHADRVGGIAAPSLAITDKENPLTGFGQITLLGDRNLADPKSGAKVFGADVYSPRYPTVRYEFSDKNVDLFNKEIKPFIDLVDGEPIKSYNLDGDQTTAIDHLERNPTILALFLKEQHGIEPKLVRVKKPILAQKYKKYIGKNYYELHEDAEFRKAVEDKYADVIENFSSRGKDREQLISDLGRGFVRELDRYAQDIKRAGKVDDVSSIREMQKQINVKKLDTEYDVFVYNLVHSLNPKEQISQRNAQGDRKYSDHSIDNVIGILKRNIRGGESGGASPGKVRAMVTPEFKSIKQIKEAKGKLVSSLDFNQLRDEMNNDVEVIADQLEGHYKYYRHSLSTTVDMLFDAANGNINSALKEHGYENVPDSVKLEISELFDKFRNMPTEYFEAKIPREVGLKEFSAAVVPKLIPKQALDILKKNGITDIKYYKDQDDRIAKIGSFKKLLFSKQQEQRPKTRSLSVSDIQPLADKVNSKLTHGEVIVLADESDLPKGTVQLKQTAWHGSPHDHNKFDSSKIGTGEGAQAYGYGHYFTDTKSVAEYYRDTLSKADAEAFYQLALDKGLSKELTDSMVDFYYKTDNKSFKAYADMVSKKSSQESVEKRREEFIRPALRDGSAREVWDDFFNSSTGKLYEVDLKPAEDEYLLWDKPLSKQSEKVKDSLKQLGINSDKSPDDMNDLELKGALGGFENTLGKGEAAGSKLYKELTSHFGGDKQASAYLHSIGIRGIKYLDGSSRSSGEGNYNYVIFDDNDVEIKVKYSKDLGMIEGAYVGDGKVYIVAGSIPTLTRAEQVIQHELSHLAAEELLDSKEYRAAIRSVQLLEKTKNKVVQDLAKEVDLRQPDLDPNTRAKEILAMSVETGKYKESNPLKRIIADIVRAFKALLRNMGAKFDFVEKMSEGEVFATMRRAMDMLYDGSKGNGARDGGVLRSSEKQGISDTITVDGVERPTTNSEGKPIYPTEDGIRNFWKWFGDSKVVDEQGRPLVVYHGTNRDFNTFDQSEINSGSGTYSGKGFYFTPSITEAGGWAEMQGEQPNVIPVYLRIENPHTFVLRNYNWQADDDFSSRLQDKGHDGIIAKVQDIDTETNEIVDEFIKEIVAFSPNQIKSAVGNNGDFSQEDNNILFSKAPPINEDNQPAKFDPNKDIPETKARAVQRAVQDKFNRFTVIKEWLEKEKGIKLSEKADVFRAEERFHSKVANQLEDFRNDVRNPLIEKMAKAGFTKDQVEEYLLNQHAQEANAQNRKLTGADTTAFGITDQEAKDYLDKAPKELADIANEIQAITDKTLDLRLDNGLESQETYDAMKGAYKHYVPVKGDAESQEGRISKGTGGKGFDLKYKGKRRLGHSARNEDAVGNIFQDYERAVLQVEKNRVAKNLALMAAEIGMPELISIDQPVKKRSIQNTKAYGVLVKGELQEVFQNQETAKQNKALIIARDKNLSPSDITIATIADQRLIYGASPMLADNEVNVYINGHAIRLQINDDLLAQAYKNMGVEALGSILRVGRAMNGWMSKVYTGYNPEFILTNIIRDFTTGVINTTGEEGITIAAKSVANYPKVFASLLKYAATGKSDKWIDGYRANGGNTGAAYLSDLERLGTEVQNEYAAYQGVVANMKQGDLHNASRAAGRKVFNKSIKYIEHLNQAGENAYRLSVYKAMIESGKSVNEAAHLAKNVTVNFNRKGEKGAELNALYLFFNAGVQGTAAMSHALFKGKHKYQAWGLAGSMGVLGALTAMSLGGFDDEDEYDKISDVTKSRNLIIKAGDGYVKIPVPYGHGFFYNLGRMTAEAIRKDEVGKLPYQLAALAIEEFSPFNMASTDEGEFDSKRVGFALLPTAAKLYAEPAFNYSSFTGREIYPESPFDKSQPDNEKMFRGTKGTAYDIAAQYLNAASGGNVEVSPETLKYLTRAATGGAGALVDSTVSGAVLKSEGAELDTREIPFIRKGYGEITVQDARAAYGKAKDEARTAAEKFSRLKRNNDLEGAAKFVDEHAELLAMNAYADSLSRFITANRDQQDAIRASKEYSVKEQRLRIKDLEKEEESYYSEYLDVFKQKKQIMKSKEK